MAALVAVLMGSKSDMEAMSSCMEALTKFGIEHEVHVMSAHRSPDRVREFVTSARDNGFEVIIAAAGGAAARAKAYANVERVHFEGVHYRRDIGATATAVAR